MLFLSFVFLDRNQCVCSWLIQNKLKQGTEKFCSQMHIEFTRLMCLLSSRSGISSPPPLPSLVNMLMHGYLFPFGFFSCRINIINYHAIGKAYLVKVYQCQLENLFSKQPRSVLGKMRQVNTNYKDPCPLLVWNLPLSQFQRSRKV